MTFSFEVYPAGSQLLFLRASLEDVDWVMREFPQYWLDYPGCSPYSRTPSELQYRELYRGSSSHLEWLKLLVPQNYTSRYLFIDVDAPGWIAVIFDENKNFLPQRIGRGIYCYVAERDRFPTLSDPLGVAQIEVSYQLREPSVEYLPFFPGDSLKVGVASTSLESRWVKSESYVRGVKWWNYQIQADGLPGFEGLDLPLKAEIPEHIRQQYRSYVAPSDRSKQFDLGPFHLKYEDIPEAVADFQRVLPFDHRGQERIVDFFNSSLVSAWLENTYGIRWNDPSFYEGESLLYIVAGPEGIKDPFTPRIPLEEYYRFQAIDPERNRALIASGKF